VVIEGEEGADLYPEDDGEEDFDGKYEHIIIIIILSSSQQESLRRILIVLIS